MDIVILHGWGQNASIFEQLNNQLKTVPSVNKVVLVNLPGFGNEKIISKDWGIPEYSVWVDTKIKEMKLKEVIVLGHSFGGRIAAFLASKNPTYLKGIVLSGAPLLYRPTRRTQLKLYASKILKKILPSNLLSKSYSLDLKQAENLGLGQVFRKAVVFDQTEYLQKIEVPTLFLWGEKDIDAPLSVAKEAKKLVNNSTIEIIPLAGHNTFYSHPYIFFSYVKKFISSI